MAEVHEKSERRTLKTVVTFLEMTSRPVRPSRPVPLRKLAVLRAEDPPLHYYRYLYDTVGGPWNWTDRRIMDRDALQALIRDPNVEIYVLYVGGVPAGFAELDFRREPEAELALFGMMPDFIGQGLGSWFLDWAVEALWRSGIERVVVDSNAHDHPRAIAMYQRAGFSVVARREAWLVPLESLEGGT